MQNSFIENSTTQLAQKDNGKRLITYLSARDNKAWFDFLCFVNGIENFTAPYITTNES